MIDWSFFTIAAAALSVERIAYVWIYRRPHIFARNVARAPLLRGLGSVLSLALLFMLFKVIQGAVFVVWCLVHGDGAIWVGGHGRTGAMAAGLALVSVGQLLNVRVFRLLGRDGVFYGNRFGLSLPWRSGFPFSIFRHPQYVGTCLTIWGIFLVTRYPAVDWPALPLLETAYYAAGAWLEG